MANDKRLVFSAAAFAQKACDYLHGLQPTSPAEGDAGGAIEAAPGA